jgi:hypothetical protein
VTIDVIHKCAICHNVTRYHKGLSRTTTVTSQDYLTVTQRALRAAAKMFSSFRQRTLQLLRPVIPARYYGTPLDIVPAISTKADGALRSHLNVPINPNHGLYAFFRKKENDDGTVAYRSVEDEDSLQTKTGAPVPEMRTTLGADAAYAYAQAAHGRQRS